MEEKLSKSIDIGLVKKVLYTADPFEREYYTKYLMRKGKRQANPKEELFVPIRYKILPHRAISQPGNP